jgi:hypothetical protein
MKVTDQQSDHAAQHGIAPKERSCGAQQRECRRKTVGFGDDSEQKRRGGNNERRAVHRGCFTLFDVSGKQNRLTMSGGAAASDSSSFKPSTHETGAALPFRG